MKIMALRTLNKINKNVVQNYCRTFSYKFDMTPTRPVQEHEDEVASPVQVAEEEVEQMSQQFGNSGFRYNVCQERTTPAEKPLSVANLMESQRQNVKTHIEEQNLQPASLPEYYNKQIDPSVNVPEGQDIAKASNQFNYRRFQESKTCANATLPLKSVKLANPFPEPVKQMYSRTVSDEEKAQQMLAESKSQRQFEASRIQALPQSRTFTTSARRYSTSSDPKKCKKVKAEKKSSCPRMNLPGCEPRTRISCSRAAMTVHCKKQEAPYPAYSEFCHEDVEEKPSECKMCPWRPEENPNFKPQKKKFHTLSALNRRTGLETVNDLNTGAEEVEESAEADEGMYCDLRKPECKRPPRRPCAEKKDPKLKRKKKREVKKEEEEKCASVTKIAEILAHKNQGKQQQALTQEDFREDCEEVDDNAMEMQKSEKADDKKDKKKGGPPTGKCKKFKFPLCHQPKKPDIPEDGTCPPKKKRPPIADCPPLDEERCDSSGNSIEYLMQEKEDDKKIKCPKIDLTTYRDEDEDPDPCKLRKGGQTQICPGDLLKKRRKPNKNRKDPAKTSPPLPPASQRHPQQSTKTPIAFLDPHDGQKT